MIGNFYIEAGLKPNNVEDSSGFDDETYTKNVDNGTYSKEIEFLLHDIFISSTIAVNSCSVVVVPFI